MRFAKRLSVFLFTVHTKSHKNILMDKCKYTMAYYRFDR